MSRIPPALALAGVLLVAACGNSPTPAAAPANAPSPTPNPFNATACKHFQTGLERLGKDLTDGKTKGYVPLVLTIVVSDSKAAVNDAAQLAEGQAKAAMERTAAAVGALGVAVKDTWQDGIDISQEVATLSAAVDAVRPLCVAAGSPVTVTFS